MIPFVRTRHELKACLALVDASPLGGGRTAERWIMAEVPSVVYRLPEYAALGITGVSIGSNDLDAADARGRSRQRVVRRRRMTSASRGARRDSSRSSRHCRTIGLTCSICGQAPSVHPEYAAMLVRLGIDSISVNVDAIDRTRHNIAVAEQSLILDAARPRSDDAREGSTARALPRWVQGWSGEPARTPGFGRRTHPHNRWLAGRQTTRTPADSLSMSGGCFWAHWPSRRHWQA